MPPSSLSNNIISGQTEAKPFMRVFATLNLESGRKLGHRYYGGLTEMIIGDDLLSGGESRHMGCVSFAKKSSRMAKFQRNRQVRQSAVIN